MEIRLTRPITPNPYHVQLLKRIGEEAFRRMGLLFIRMPNSASTSMAMALSRKYQAFPCRLHIRIIDYVEAFGLDFVKEMPVFGCFRDPLDCFIAQYHRTIRTQYMYPELKRMPIDTFEEFFAYRKLRKRMLLYEDMVVDAHGECFVDQGFPFEQVSVGWDRMCEASGVTESLSHKNGNVEPEDSIYTKEYVEQFRAIQEAPWLLYEDCCESFT